MTDFLLDARYALRALGNRPGFTLAAVVTLALGIGATSTVFSVADHVWFRPLGYPEPQRLVQLLGYREGDAIDLDRAPIAFPNFYDIRAANSVFDAVAAYDEYEATLLRDGEAERISGATVTAEFFDVLGVRPALGRFFLAEENVPGQSDAVVLSYPFWQARFGGDPAVVGGAIELNGVPLTVVGVAPRDLEDPMLAGVRWGAPALWRATPPWFDPAEQPRGGQAFTAIARLKTGVSLAAAQAEVSTIMARLEAAYPDEMRNDRIRLIRLVDRIVGPVRPALAALLAGVVLLLLIACANYAGLLLSRAGGRARELAVRAALGAGTQRLLRLQLVESVTLALLGGAVGALLAVWGTDLFRALGAADLPRADRIALDARVLGVTAGVALLAGLASGIVPTLHALRRDPAAELHGARGTAGGDQLRLRRTLITAQVALVVVLLAGAGLLGRSLLRLQAVDPGLDPDGVLTFEITPGRARYDTDEVISRLYDDLLARLGSLPGVTGVATVSLLPMSGSFNGMGFRLEDRPPPPPGEGAGAETRVVSPGFFATMGIRVLRGRPLRREDRAGAAAVLVVTEALARRYWPEGDAVGRRITLLGVSWEIVGVVEDVHQFTLAETPEPQIYLPHAQTPATWMRLTSSVVLRVATDPAGLASAARAAVREIDPAIPVSAIRPMRAVVAATTARERFRTALTALFAATALALGAVGVAGVVSYATTRRTREFGIRLALGASPSALLRSAVGAGVRPVVVGVSVGLAAAVPTGRALAGLLFGVSPWDPASLAAAAAVLLAAAALACYLPARRAARVDPAEALRHE